MKSTFIRTSLYVLPLAAAMLTACDSKDDTEPDFPIIPVSSNSNVYILTEGSYYDKIEGGLNVIDLETGILSSEVFAKANGRSLGASPQCGAAYGDKIYVGCRESNTIEIIDKKTYKSVKQISLSNEIGQNPSSMVVRDGKVYISMYNGYVSRLDTINLSIDATVKVGPNPENIAIQGQYLFVPNSDGMNYPNYGNTVSRINITRFTEVETFNVPVNPNTFLTNGNNLFLLCMGNYSSEEAAVYRVNPQTLECVKVAPATMATISGNYLFLINAPFNENAVKVSYKRFNIMNGALTEMINNAPFYPSGIGVDPTTGNIIISSYYQNGLWPDYLSPQYVYEYHNDGDFIREYKTITGGPAKIFFQID